MFCLTLVNDVIPVEPTDFNKDHRDLLKTLISDKYVDRVINGVGLVVAFYDFVDILEAKVYPNDGRSHFKVNFKLIVFQPFRGEILQGYVSSADALGIGVSLEFFQDVRIPAAALREPKSYNEETKTWSWDFEGHKLSYVQFAAIRFRVQDIVYNKDKQQLQKRVLEDATDGNTPLKQKDPPMAIIVRIKPQVQFGVYPSVDRTIGHIICALQGAVDEDGLGLRSWWE